MPSPNVAIRTLAVLSAALLLPAAAAAQGTSAESLYTYSVSLMGGLGGSVDEDDAGYENQTLQIGGSVVTEDDVRVGLRIGTMEFSDDVLGDLFDGELTYATIAGEYRYGESTYQSGLFFGLGVYRLEGNRTFTAEPVSTNRLGLTAGATGEFDISNRFVLLAELTAHVLPSGEAQFFVSGLIGVGYYIK